MEYSLMQRDGYCRGCDSLLPKGNSYAVKFYSVRNRGQHILICATCVNRMQELIDEYNSEVT